MFFILWNKLVFFVMFFLSPEFKFFSEIGNNPMLALGRKKHMFFFGYAAAYI